MRFKKTFWGSLKGAILFAGMYVFLTIAVCYGQSLLPSFVQKLLLLDKWTYERVYQAFLLTIGLGIIWGGVVSSQRSHLKKKWLNPLVCFCIPIILAGWFFYKYAGLVEFPSDIKLADCNSNIVTFRFTVPKGRRYLFELATSAGSTNRFSGQVSILDKANLITNFYIGPDNAKISCDFFHANTSYDVKVIFDQFPPPSTSILLKWLQAYKDKKT